MCLDVFYLILDSIYQMEKMETIIIQAQSKSTTKLLLSLTKKLGENAHILDPEIAEDLALGTMMNKEKTGKIVSKTSVLSLLIP